MLPPGDVVQPPARRGRGLLALAPLFFGMRLTSKGPAMQRQTRIGEHGKSFTLYKFRSMYQDAEAAALIKQNDGLAYAAIQPNIANIIS